MKIIHQFISFWDKLWEFLRSAWEASWKLFKRELKEKHSNAKNMTPTTFRKAIVPEIFGFFVSGAKALAEQGLQSTSPKTATLLGACCLPYDNCFLGDGGKFNLFRLFSTFSWSLGHRVFNGSSPTLLDRSSFNLNMNTVSSLTA